ncbi:MAG: hypothetical protein D6E12_13915 [Desulfovibrio sp.]|nr:MAG: hypothetical protein D6E12_13915 [Desulfovibrio sp.]
MKSLLFVLLRGLHLFCVVSLVFCALYGLYGYCTVGDSVECMNCLTGAFVYLVGLSVYLTLVWSSRRVCEWVVGQE